MKLLYVVPEFGVSDTAVEVRTRFHVEALIDAGFSVDILTSGPISESRESITRVGRGLAKNVAPLFQRLIGEITFGLRLAYALIQTKNVKGVIVTSPPFFTAAIVCFTARVRNLPVIMDVRDRYPQVFFSVGVLNKSSLIGRTLRNIERNLYQKSELVVTVTDALGNRMMSDTGRKVEIVRNGFDNKLFFEKSGRRETSSDTPTVTIVSHGLFGQLFDEIGFLHLVDKCAIAKTPHEFLLIGYGPKLDAIREMGRKNIRVLGPMSQERVAEFVRESDIGISIHSFQESSKTGFAVKVYEYIGAGLPVLVTPDNEAGRIVRENNLGVAYDSVMDSNAASVLIDWIDNKVARRSSRADSIELVDSLSRQYQASRFAGLVANALTAVRT